MTNKSFNLESARRAWHPIASSSDLVPRHVFHAQLLGRELALWRADDRHVNAWENRCLHRGVRLSIGVNDGRELICQYHGWRYANRTAGCTYIPAHPADAPARTICNNTYPAIEKYGLVWSGDAPEAEIPALDMLSSESLVLRPIPVNASLDRIATALLDYRNDYTVERLDTCSLVCHSTRIDVPPLVFFLQPTDSDRTVIRGIISSLSPAHMPDSNARLAVLREHNQVLSGLRDKLETSSSEKTNSVPMPVSITPVSEKLAQLPELANSGRTAPLRVLVAATRMTASDVKLLKLTPIDQPLPTYQPGAHIDVHLPNGLIRQYSLTNAPGQTDCYIIGVKREAESSGGSACIHDVIKEGDTLAISEPRNNFPLRRDALNTVLIAGGIGITPLLSMAQALQHSSLPFTLHYFVQEQNNKAFSDVLDSLQNNWQLHVGLSAADTQQQLRTLLENVQSAHHVYLCGPAPMLEAARAIATDTGWPDESIHIEYFKNTQVLETNRAFSVSLARSGLTLNVPAGKTLLNVLRENNVALPSSCEQGACGTCKVKVLSGEPWHQDVYLSPSEQKRGDCMMTCVSRAHSDSLTLDI